MPERRLPPDLAQWVVQALSRLLATFAILQGAAIILGGRDRWQGSGFTVAMTVPGAPATWGWALLGFGAAALWATWAPKRRVAAVALTGIGAWCLFFAGSFVKVVLDIPNAPTTGIFTYGFMAVFACVLAVAYRRSQA